jgi:hypothetical protein
MKKILLLFLFPLLAGCMVTRSAVRPAALDVKPADLQTVLIPSTSNDPRRLNLLAAVENQTLLAQFGLRPNGTIYFSPDGFAFQLDTSGYIRIVAWTIESRPGNRLGYEICMAGDPKGTIVLEGMSTIYHRKGQKVTCAPNDVIFGLTPLKGDKHGLQDRYKQENIGRT